MDIQSITANSISKEAQRSQKFLFKTPSTTNGNIKIDESKMKDLPRHHFTPTEKFEDTEG